MQDTESRTDRDLAFYWVTAERAGEVEVKKKKDKAK